MTTNTKYILLGSTLVLIGMLLYSNFSSAINKVVNISRDQNLISMINQTNARISYYATPRGEQTGIGMGIDLFKMSDDYGKNSEPLRQVILTQAAKDLGLNINNYNTSMVDWSLLDQWYSTGVYEKYLTAKQNNSGFNAVLNFAKKVIPVVIALV